MSQLLNYLNTLDKDASAREAHNKNPKAAMTKHGLSEDEQVALISADRKMLAALVDIRETSLPSIQVHISTFDDVKPQAWECATYLNQANKQHINGKRLTN